MVNLPIWLTTRLQVLFLVLAPALVYIKTLAYDFSPSDEQWMILNRIEFLKHWGNFPALFNQALDNIYYRPLLTLSFMLNAHLSGTDPWTYHLLNLMLHIVNVLLLYRLLILLQTNTASAFTLTLLFAVHPALCHAVAWVPGRNDVLLSIFTLSAIMYLLKWCQSHKIVHLLLYLLFFVLALFTKENSILVPIIFSFILYWKKIPGKHFSAHALLWILLLVCWFALKHKATTYLPSTNQAFTLTLKNSLMAFLLYAGKVIWPLQQAVIPTLKNTSILPGIITVIILLFLFFKYGLKHNHLTVLSLLMIVVSLVLPLWYKSGISGGEHYEHRLYLPMAGFILLLAQIKPNLNYPLVLWLLLITFLALATKTWLRAQVYQSNISYLDEAIQNDPNNYYYQSAKASFMLKKGNYSTAVECLNKAIALHPSGPLLYVNLASAYTELGDKRSAIATLNTVLEMSPKIEFMYQRYQVYKRFNDTLNAEKDLKILKEYYGPDYQPGMSAEELKLLNRARLQNISRLIQQRPNTAVNYIERAKIYMDLRMPKEALADLTTACALEPANQEYKTYFDQLNRTFPH